MNLSSLLSHLGLQVYRLDVGFASRPIVVSSSGSVEYVVKSNTTQSDTQFFCT